MPARIPEGGRAPSGGRWPWRSLLPSPETALPADERPAGAATRMGAATLASRGIGFARIWAVTAILGTTYLGNSFQASNSVSNVLFELLAAGALSAVLVPTFVELLDLGDQREAERLAAGLLGLAVVVLGAVAVVGVLAAPTIAGILTTGAPKGAVADQQRVLSTFFLRFFIPQVVLYAFGTVATAVLFAQRRFVVTAVAPIANTVVLVAALLVFHAMHPGTGLDLTLGEKLVLAVGGTLGVLGFCGVPVVALLCRGFRLRARVRRPDARLRQLLRLSTWAVLQHAGIGILLAASIVMGNQVAGGVVAYQFAFVAFLAPYAILAQPVHTTILPALALDAAVANLRAFAGRVRWALESLALLVFPVSAAMVALAEPAMRAITFGEGRGGVNLLAAALASLALGLYPYSAFLLFTRAFYALGDSRTPAIVALITAIAGAVVMIIGGVAFDGAAIVAALGIGNSVTYLIGAGVLAVGLSRRLEQPIVPEAAWRPLVLSVGLGLAAWAVERAIAPVGRIATLLLLALIGVVGGAAYLIGLRALSRASKRADPREGLPTVASEPELDPDLANEP